MSIIPVRKDCK